AGHPGDHERQRELPAEEGDTEFDVRGIDGGERVVDDVDVLPAGRCARLDVGLGRQLQVLALAPRDVVGLVQSNTPSAASARYSDSPMPSSPRQTSALCSPRTGPARSSAAGVAESTNGGAISVTLPSTGCATRRQNPRCASCGSAASSAIVSTGATWRPCWRSTATISSRRRPHVQPSP